MEVARRIGSLALFALVLAGLFLFFRPAPAPADGKIHVRYWEKWTGAEEDALRKVVARFNARQDRIHVDLLSVSQVNNKLLLATAGGNPPDVAGIWDNDIPVFADYGALAPLDQYCEASGIGPDHYLPAYWSLARHGGHTYALPTAPGSSALFYNRKHFVEAGLDPDRPPVTLDELDDYSQRLTLRDRSGAIVQTGFLPAEPGWWNWGWGYWFGGRLWDGESRITLTTPENIRAFNWVQSYVNRYETRELTVFSSGFGNFSSPNNPFMSGKVSMVLQGVWMANYIHNSNPNLDWDAAPFPYPADHPELARSTPIGSDVMVIPTGAKHPAEAWEFIRFVQSQGGMEMLCKLQWKHSPLREVSPEFYRGHKNKRVKLFYDLAAGKNTFSWPRVGIWKEWQDEMKTAFEKLWTQRQSPESVLRYAEHRMQPKLTAYLKSVERRSRRP